MKIAVITQYFPSSAEPWQGRSVYQQLRVLARNSDVQVYYPCASYPPMLKPHSRNFQRLDASYSPPEVKVNYYNYFALPLLSRAFNGRSVARLLLPHVRAFAPDIIFSCFLYPEGYAAVKIGKALSVPVVAMSIGSDINRICDFVSAMHTRTVLRNADFIVTVSGDLRNKAIAMGAPPEKTRAILNGCDLSVFCVRDRLEARRKLKIDANVEAIVYVGRMDVKKGLRELVKATASLHTERPNLHTYLVGEGADRPIIEKAIQDHNAVGYIHALPGCAFDDVAVWMTAADLVTLPSYMEGCPNAVIEALASGRPVVATNVGGIPEIMQSDCGLLVPPCDSVALARAFASVLSTRWDAAAISSLNSRSWSVPAAELREIFESLLSGRQA